MTEFSTPSSSSSSPPPSQQYHFSAHLLSEFHNSICSLKFLSSTKNPLYLPYLILLFSSCLLKLISFLIPPLFLAAFLLLLSILLVTIFFILPASVIHGQNVDQKVMTLEALQLCSIVFDVADQVLEEFAEEESPAAIILIEEPPDAAAIMTLPTLLHQKEELDDQLGVLLEGKEEEEEVAKQESVKLSTKVEDKEQRGGLSNSSSDDKEVNFSSQRRSQSDGGMTEASPWSSPSSLGSYGSMRKEKEWRRTLACKLFEERYNNNTADKSDEGMDLLWETYEEEETESSASDDKVIKPKTTKSKSRKSNRIVHHSYADDDDCGEEEVGGDDDHGGKLCCLQALKFSTGKMKLGMGKPNLLKISKAIKGIGWLHHHVTATTTTRLHSRKKLQPLN